MGQSRMLGKGLLQGMSPREQEKLEKFLAVTAAAKSQQIGGEWDTQGWIILQRSSPSWGI